MAYVKSMKQLRKESREKDQEYIKEKARERSEQAEKKFWHELKLKGRVRREDRADNEKEEDEQFAKIKEAMKKNKKKDK